MRIFFDVLVEVLPGVAASALTAKFAFGGFPNAEMENTGLLALFRISDEVLERSNEICIPNQWPGCPIRKLSIHRINFLVSVRTLQLPVEVLPEKTL